MAAMFKQLGLIGCGLMGGSFALAMKQAGLVAGNALSAKVILSGEISRKVALKGVGATKGAKAAIEAAGGSVAE